MRLMHDPMMVRAKHDHVPANVWAASTEILDVVRFGIISSVLFRKAVLANLTMMVVIRFEHICERRVSHEDFLNHCLPRNRIQNLNPVVVENALQRSFSSKSLCD